MGSIHALKRITEELGIADKVAAVVTDDKVAAVVTDNGANMVNAVHKAGWRHHP